ncbi:MAG: glycerol kinase, partial [Oricola sp.]|nr:glycerol kinase [Oricola sp.]
GKWRWLLDEAPDGRTRAAAGEIRLGTVDSWLLWKLTAGAEHATDHSNASRTQLFNLDTLEWDPRLAEIFDVPLRLLPEIRDSDSLFGRTAPDCCALPAGTPIHAIMGDSHAALFAHGIRQPGGVKATIGTGSSLMTPTAQRVASSHGLSSTIAWSRSGVAQHALEGNISVSGQAAAFAASMLGLEDSDAVTALAATVEDNGGVVFVPALVGLGAPHWCSSSRGSISGLSLATRPAHIARAVIEAVALQIFDVFTAIEADLGETIPMLSIDGGAARSDFLAQMIADLLDRDVMRPKMADASPIGAALMAIEACGLADHEPSAAPRDRFSPSMPGSQRDAIHEGWAASIKSLLASAGRRSTQVSD